MFHNRSTMLWEVIREIMSSIKVYCKIDSISNHGEVTDILGGAGEINEGINWMILLVHFKTYTLS
jgi:hypothetical protein